MITMLLINYCANEQRFPGQNGQFATFPWLGIQAQPKFNTQSTFFPEKSSKYAEEILIKTCCPLEN